MERFIVGSSIPLEYTFTVDGVATAADGAVTVTITRDDGTALVTAGATTHVPTGTYRYVIPVQTGLDILTARFSGTFGGNAQTSRPIQVEIAGDVYIDTATLSALPDMSTYTDEQVRQARTWFEDTFERYTGRAFVPRYHRETVDGNGKYEVMLSRYPVRRLRAVSIDGTAVNTADLSDTALWLAYDWGKVRYVNNVFTSGYRNVTVAYEHGMDSTPTDITEAAKVAIPIHMNEAASGNRQFALQTDFGIIRQSTPSGPRPFGIGGTLPGTPFGIPFVDEVANAYADSGAFVG